jgi:TPR repeat protein/S1-C subfamily serine protease
MKRLLVFLGLGLGLLLIFLVKVEVKQEPEIEIEIQSVLKRWQDAYSLYFKSSNPNDRQKARQFWEEIAKMPPAEKSPLLDLIVKSALATGQFDAARNALVVSGQLPTNSNFFRTENLQNLRWESPPASSVVRIDDLVDDTVFAPIGTGTVISKGDWILTAAHVLAKTKKPVVVFPDGSGFAIQFVYPGNFRDDLALIKVEKKSPNYANLATGSPSLGDTVYSMGFPWGSLLPVKSSGQLKDYSYYGGQSTVTSSLSFAPGNSGSGVFNLEGKLVGMVHLMWSDSSDKDAASTHVALWEDIVKITHAAEGTQPSPFSDRWEWAKKSSLWGIGSRERAILQKAAIATFSDPANSLNLYKAAYDEGIMKAAYILGNSLMTKPNRSPHDEEDAYRYFSVASDSDPACLTYRGWHKMEGIGTNPDPVGGMNDLEEAAKKGDRKAQVIIASLLFDGKQLPFDYKKAMLLAEENLNKGIKDAYRVKLLGLLSNIMFPGNERPPLEALLAFDDEMSYPKNFVSKQKAIDFFEFCVIASAKDVIFAKVLLAHCYLQGFGTEVNFSKGISILEDEGNEGNELAIATLGRLFIPKAPTDVHEDYDKSIYWFGRLADKGNLGAKLTYGSLCLIKEKTKTPQNSAMPGRLSHQAFTYLVEAANSDDSEVAPEAQYLLGREYFYGIYLPKDLFKAVHYLEKANSNGLKEALTYLIQAKSEISKSK